MTSSISVAYDYMWPGTLLAGGGKSDRDWETHPRKVRGPPLASELQITVTLLPTARACVCARVPVH